MWGTHRRATPSGKRWVSSFLKWASLLYMILACATSTFGAYSRDLHRSVLQSSHPARCRHGLRFSLNLFPLTVMQFLALYCCRMLVCSCVRYEPSDVGIVTLSTFLQFWGVVFLATTVWLCLFKPEIENGVNDEILGLVDTYKQVCGADGG